MNKYSIPFAKNNIKNEDIDNVSKILKSGWLTHGKYTKQLEDCFSKFTGAKYAITVSNCTAGLHLSCMAANFKKGDEILVPAMTHVATAHAVSITGAKPIFCDVNLYDGSINVDDLIKKINKKTRGIIVVHMAGFPNQMNKILEVSKKFKLKIIEDCAHSLGTTFENKHVGNFGISGVFSFYPTKQIGIGEGGVVITNDNKIFKKIKTSKAFGIDKDIFERKFPGFYDVKYLGVNYRMADYQASLALSQLKRYDKELAIRKKNAQLYCDGLKNIKWVKFEKYNSKCSYFIFQIFVPTTKRLKLIKCFIRNKIGFSIHYANSIDNMSYYASNKYCKNSRIYSNKVLSLPVHSGINLKMIKRICQIIKKI